MNEAKELLKLRQEYGCRRENSDYTRTVFKLYNDRITLTNCFLRKVRFKRFDENYKVNLESGELIPYTFEDCKKQKRNLETSVNRAKRYIDDICLKNAFDFFVTVTFNMKFVDRYSAESVHRAFACVMKRLRRKYGKVSFIAVPEYHEDKAIHYHCFMSFERKPKLLYSRDVKAYFFMDEFKKNDCFLVAEKVNGGLPTGYLKKYINKNSERPLYRRFSCSRDLKRSKVIDSVVYEVYDSMANKVVKERGFKLYSENRFARSFRYVVSAAGERGARASETPPAADSSIHDINDRNEGILRELFSALVAEIHTLSRLRRDNIARYDGNGVSVTVGGKRQLSFLFV